MDLSSGCVHRRDDKLVEEYHLLHVLWSFKISNHPRLPDAPISFSVSIERKGPASGGEFTGSTWAAERLSTWAPVGPSVGVQAAQERDDVQSIYQCAAGRAMDWRPWGLLFAALLCLLQVNILNFLHLFINEKKNYFI